MPVKGLKMNLKSLPKIERPREKLIQKGPQNLKDEEGIKANETILKELED